MQFDPYIIHLVMSSPIKWRLLIPIHQIMMIGNGIKEMFKSFGITPDEVKILATQIVLEPLPALLISDTPVVSPNIT